MINHLYSVTSVAGNTKLDKAKKIGKKIVNEGEVLSKQIAKGYGEVAEVAEGI